MPRLLVVNGPNLDILGTREPELYGPTTLVEIEACLADLAARNGVELECFQTNYEGAAVDKLHAARGTVDAIIINPASFTPYGVGVRIALVAAQVPAILVHITNVYRPGTDPEARRDVFAPVVIGQICGLGAYGYVLAFHAALRHLGAGLQSLKEIQFR